MKNPFTVQCTLFNVDWQYDLRNFMSTRVKRHISPNCQFVEDTEMRKTKKFAGGFCLQGEEVLERLGKPLPEIFLGVMLYQTHRSGARPKLDISSETSRDK